MNPFDDFVKREMRCQGYARFVDDFLLFADDKATLLDWREAIIHRLVALRLTTDGFLASTKNLRRPPMRKE